MRRRRYATTAVVLISASIGGAFSAWRFVWLLRQTPGLGISDLSYMTTRYSLMTIVVGVVAYGCVDVVIWLHQAGLTRRSLMACGWLMLV
ncbi:MAG: hypothetical protein WA726_11075, partial [Acidimicrobiia bacterium]